MTSRRFLLAGFLLLLAVRVVAQTQTQTPTPTADQMAIFQNLPPEQQQAILEGLATEGGDGTRRDPDLEMPGTTQRGAGDDATRGRGTTATGRTSVDPLELEREPRIEGGDTVLIGLKLRRTMPPTIRTLEEQKRVDEVLERALQGNPYRLDRSGFLRIPGLAPIALAGLTEEQATARLRGEPALREFESELILLPLERQDEDALEPFGYDIFEGAPTTFAPVSEVPVPSQVRRRTRRSPRGAADRQHQGPLFAGREPGRARDVPRTRADRGGGADFSAGEGTDRGLRSPSR